MLEWGYRYAAVRPDHFRVDYQINPFMDVSRQPDLPRALQQWDAMVRTLRDVGAEVDLVEQRPDSPDMVYAMNLGLALTGADGAARVAMSHMRYPQRRLERHTAAAWYAERGFEPVHVGRDGVGPHFEAGDAFPYAGRLVVGYGPRSDELALKHLATELDVSVTGVRIVHPSMYHLDLAFCPIDERRALVCTDAFDEASAALLLDLVPEPILIDTPEAMTFCANSVVVGDTVVMPACPSPVRDRLERAGLRVVLVDVSELHKGGGSVGCLTNPLDIVVGRDLAAVPGGEVVLPPATV